MPPKSIKKINIKKSKDSANSEGPTLINKEELNLAVRS